MPGPGVAPPLHADLVTVIPLKRKIRGWGCQNSQPCGSLRPCLTLTSNTTSIGGYRAMMINKRHVTAVSTNQRSRLWFTPVDFAVNKTSLINARRHIAAQFVPSPLSPYNHARFRVDSVDTVVAMVSSCPIRPTYFVVICRLFIAWVRSQQNTLTLIPRDVADNYVGNLNH